MPTVPTPSTSKSGIATTAHGERHIPSSTRPDGSVRREIKVRPGYRPPEDVEVYKNVTAEAWRIRGGGGSGGGGGGVPGAESVEGSKAGSTSASVTANKNAKRREARRKAAAAAAGTETDGKGGSGARASEQRQDDKSQDKQQPAGPDTIAAEADADQDREKEARKLCKKLRQARDLKDRKEKGDALLPEQFEKVIRINELIRQLDGLGFDSNGERKGDS